MGRLNRDQLSRVVSGEYLLCDVSGEIIDTKLEQVDGRRYTLYSSFVKMKSTFVRDMQEAGASSGLIAYAGILAETMNKNNVIDFEPIENAVSLSQFNRVRADLRRLAVIDKLKLDKVAKWYINPYMFTKSKTCDARLANHFLNRMKNEGHINQ